MNHASAAATLATTGVETAADARQLAQDLVQRALKAGATQADALLVRSSQTHTSLRLGELEELEREESVSVGLRVWRGQQVASCSSTDLSARGLAALAEHACAMATATPEDAFARLIPAAEIAAAGGAEALDLYEAQQPSLAWLQEQCARAEDAARAVAGVTNSKGASASIGTTLIALATSEGFADAYAATSCSLSASMVAGEGLHMQRDYAHSAARHHTDLKSAEAIGREAGERTVARMHPRIPNTTEVPVIFEPRVARGLLGSLSAACNGMSIANGSSFLREAMGTRIFPAGVHITDDPLRARGMASRPWDGEAMASARMDLIEDGILRQWLLDTRSAARLGLRSTGHATRGISGPPAPAATNLTLLAGNDSPEAMIGDIKDGLYVTEVFGSGINLVTGDYSQGAMGIWIENGKLAYPVSEITIAGRLQDMFANLLVANDLRFEQRMNAPTVCVGRMTVAGNSTNEGAAA